MVRCYSPCHIKPRALVRSCVVFQSAMRPQENRAIFRLAILCALITLSLCFYGSHNAYTAHGMSKTQWQLKERLTMSVQTPRTITAFVQHRNLVRVPYGAAMATLRQPHCALFRKWATALVLSMLKVRAVVRGSMRSHSVARAPRRSVFFLDAVGPPRERCSGVTRI